MTLTTCPDCGTPMSTSAVACPKCGWQGARKRARIIASVLALVALGFAAFNSYTTYMRTSSPGNRVNYRGVHSGQKERVAFFYDLAPDCKIEGYPEITVTRPPSQGDVFAAQGQANTAYTRENSRFECNRTPSGATLVFYRSKPSFHGRDSFTILVRFPENGTLWTESYVVDVM